MFEKPFALSIKVVILDANGRCLLLKRSMSSKANAGKWDLPGGKINIGERFDEALLREVAEETGLTIALQEVAGIAESESPSNRIAYLILEGRPKSGELLLSREHDDCAWVDLRELPAMDLCEQFRSFAREYSRMHT